MQPVSHIKIVTGNALGNDYIITDLHGSLNIFQQQIVPILEQNPQDRLFICGDLVDRGEASYDLVMCVKNLMQKFPGRLFCIRGNHEDMYLSNIEAFADTAVLEDAEQCANRSWYIFNNGGEWFFRLKQPEKNEIAEFFKTLPYIIYVEKAAHATGNRVPAFQIVHATPLTEPRMQALCAGVKKGQSVFLSSDEIHCITWARPKSIDSDNTISVIQRAETTTSIPTITYVGHTVFGARYSDYDQYTVCLDAGTARNQTVFMANHTEGDIKCIQDAARLDVSAGQQEIVAAFEALKEQMQGAHYFLGLFMSDKDLNGYDLYLDQTESTPFAETERDDTRFIGDNAEYSLHYLGFFMPDDEIGYALDEKKGNIINPMPPKR